MDPQIIFWIFSLLLLVIAMVFLLPPLLRKPTDIIDDRREQNIHITRHQLAELEAEFKEGKLEQATYQVAKEELEEALYDDLDKAEDSSKLATAQSYSILPAIGVALLVPALAIGMYVRYGQPKALAESSVVVAQPAASSTANNSNKPKLSMQQMVAQLEERLQAKPDDAKGWVMLGRSYRVINRPDKALQAYQKAFDLNPDEPDTLLLLADAIGTSQAGDLTGKPEELILKALAKDPESLVGLWLAGMASKQRGDSLAAIEYWKKVVPRLDLGSDERNEVIGLIKSAGGNVADSDVGSASMTMTKPTQPAATSSITVSIDLANELKANASPEQTVFIYAKALSGPPMPLAALRKQVKDLPLTVILDDSMAMMPQLKLSGFQEVTVGARISVSGTPTKNPGDLFVEQSPVKLGESVPLMINQVVK